MSPDGLPESVSVGKIILECYVTMRFLKSPRSDSYDDDFTSGFLEFVFFIFESLKLVICGQSGPICLGCERGPDAARCGPPNDQNAPFWLW